MLTVVPSIDFFNGRPCRLYQGDPAQATYYNVDPIDWALALQASGAQRLHLVDLDAALHTQPSRDNRNLCIAIRRRLKIPVQIGGGIRTVADLRWVYQHVFDQAVIGTRALRPDAAIRQYLRSYFGRIVVADVGYAEGLVSVDGWQQRTSLSVGEALAYLARLGIGRAVLTNIQHDGTGIGPDIETVVGAAHLFPRLSFVLSGGISTIEHIDALRAIRRGNLHECIIGKRLWDSDGLEFFQRAIDHCRRDI